MRKINVAHPKSQLSQYLMHLMGSFSHLLKARTQSAAWTYPPFYLLMISPQADNLSLHIQNTMKLIEDINF
jgi:hypothetical protein